MRNEPEQRVLVLPSTEADARAIGKLFETNGVAFAACRNVSHLCELLDQGAATLLVAQEAMLADSEALIARISSQPVWSDLPIIVLSRSGRESVALPGILVALGNVSVIERPVRTSTLV